jgi:hypothetical protein
MRSYEIDNSTSKLSNLSRESQIDMLLLTTTYHCSCLFIRWIAYGFMTGGFVERSISSLRNSEITEGANEPRPASVGLVLRM